GAIPGLYAAGELVGGLFYSLGALVYATRRPDPAPRTFGYHEVFHLFTLIAAICHYIAIMFVLAETGHIA
ncbi:MAG: hemolysin III family protein, partial [Frankia sp.]